MCRWGNSRRTHAAIGLDTVAGGWRIVKTMGVRLTKLCPMRGSCAEIAGAAMLAAANWLVLPHG